jgi:hypothetical protein
METCPFQTRLSSYTSKIDRIKTHKQTNKSISQLHFQVSSS